MVAPHLWTIMCYHFFEKKVLAKVSLDNYLLELMFSSVLHLKARFGVRFIAGNLETTVMDN